MSARFPGALDLLTCAPAEVLPLAIYYTGFNSAQGDRYVQFTYEVRPTTGGANDPTSTLLDYLLGG